MPNTSIPEELQSIKKNFEKLHAEASKLRIINHNLLDIEFSKFETHEPELDKHLTQFEEETKKLNDWIKNQNNEKALNLATNTIEKILESFANPSEKQTEIGLAEDGKITQNMSAQEWEDTGFRNYTLDSRESPQPLSVGEARDNLRNSVSNTLKTQLTHLQKTPDTTIKANQHTQVMQTQRALS